MKLYHYILSAALLTLSIDSYSQVTNWNETNNKSRYILTLSLGLEYGLVYSVGLGYQTRSKHPSILNIAFSAPAGRYAADDLKIKIGGQTSVYRSGNFHAVANMQAIIRRYQNSYVRMINVGSEFSGVVGYYQGGWFVASEMGFDKAILTNIRHTNPYRVNFPDAKSGWYEPSTGGNFYYGLQSGFTIRQNYYFLQLGKLITQDFKTKPSIPYYFNAGVSLR